MNILIILGLGLNITLMSFYLDASFEKRTNEMIKELQEIRQEMNKLSSISATMYGQIVEREEDKKDEQVQSEVCDTHGVSSKE